MTPQTASAPPRALRRDQPGFLRHRRRKDWFRQDRSDRRRITIGVPAALIIALLALPALIALPVLAIVAAARGVNPFDALWRLVAVLAALSGTSVEVEAPDADVLVRIF